MQKFTVILLDPSYLDDDTNTRLFHVEADNPHMAVEKAQKDACESNDGANPSDFLALYVFSGHLDGL